MAQISRAEATATALAYVKTLSTRVEAYLRSRAQAGFVGGVFAYTAQDTGPQAQAAKTELEALGWTVVVDVVGQTVTIS